MTCRIARVLGIGIVALLAAFPLALVVADDDENEVEFTGTITSLPSTPGFIGDWMVGGRTVHVTAGTRIERDGGVIVVGARVEVEGRARSDGSVDAQKIELKERDDGDDDDEGEVDFVGIIQTLPATPGFIGDWKVSGRTVHVTAGTRIERDGGVVAIGARVEVEGRARSDGSIDAQKIEVKDGDDDDDDEDEFEFVGFVQTLPTTPGFIGVWRVGDRMVRVTSATRILTKEGPIVLGALVEVKGTQRADGSIDATRIEVQENEVEIKGVIESLPGTPGFIGDWKVGGRTVRVGLATRIDQEDGAVALGAFVEVTGSLRADGSIAASKIEVKSAGEGNPNKLKGTIQALPASSLMGDWVVSGRLVHVVSSTRLESKGGVFAVGTSVKIKGISMADGSIVATRIQIRNGG